MPDSLYQILRDSLTQAQNYPLRLNNNSWIDSVNLGLAIFGGIGTILGIMAFMWQVKSKRSNKLLYRVAKDVLEKEDVQSQLVQSKEEQKRIEERLQKLQSQIKKDLPIEARKAVLKDRLEESLENLTKYHADVISTKEKLAKLGESDSISNEILVAVESEIQPKYIIREKISANKTYLSIASTLSGIAFVILPESIGNLVGIFFLLAAIPFVFLLIKDSLNLRSGNKEKNTAILKLILSGASVLIFFSLTAFFLIIIFDMPDSIDTAIYIVVAICGACLIASLIWFLIEWKKFKKIKVSSN